MQEFVLHLTDFHVANPKNAELQEVLREGFYDEYLNQLAVKIKSICESVSALIITGDFVHKGDVSNFAHCKMVIEYIARILQIPANQIFLCPGNHDIVRDDERRGNFAQAWSHIRSFIGDFVSNLLKGEERFKLSKVNEDLYVLMLDSIWNRSGDFPCNLTPSETDEIMGIVKTVPKDACLIIGSHYPALSFPTSLGGYSPDEADYHKRHIWSSAFLLRERISRGRPDGKTIWLSGDIHMADQLLVDGIVHVVTGRFGTPPENNASILPRQAKLLRVSDDVRISTFEYRVPTHQDQGMVGNWEIASEDKAPRKIHSGEKEQSHGSSDPEKQVNVCITADRDSAVEEFDPNLSEKILNELAQNRLYRLGRFRASNDGASLGWVSIGPLMNSIGFLEVVSNAMADWVKGRAIVAGSVDLNEVVLIGVDCWGAVLASLVSVKIGVPNYCVAARAKAQYHSHREKVSQNVADAIARHRVVVLVTDVIVSGGTVRYVYEEILAKLKDVEIVRWFVMAIIIDEKGTSGISLEFAEGCGSACKTLRLPKLNADMLPEERILPWSKSFH